MNNKEIYYFLNNPIDYLNKYSKSIDKYNLLLQIIENNILLLSDNRKLQLKYLVKLNNLKNLNNLNNNMSGGSDINKLVLMLYIIFMMNYMYKIDKKTLALSQVQTSNEKHISPNYILFTFLGGLPIGYHWETFISTITDKCIIVVHPMNLSTYDNEYFKMNKMWNKLKENNQLLIVDEEHHVQTSWATRSLVDAYLLMIQYALIKKGNIFKKVVLLSDTCYPLYNFNILYNELCKDTKSWIYINDDSYTRSHQKIFYEYEGGIFNIDNGIFMSQWHILDSSHLIYYFDYDVKTQQYKKTYHKIPEKIKCNNKFIELIEAINPKLKFQQYLISMYGAYNNNIHKLINNIESNIYSGFCIGLDEHFIGNIFLFNINLENLNINLRMNKINNLLHIADVAYIENDNNKNILLHHPFEGFNTTETSSDIKVLPLNRIWYGNKISLNKYNIKKKVTVYINTEFESKITHLITDLLNKFKQDTISYEIYEQIKQINITYLTLNYPKNINKNIIPKKLKHIYKVLPPDIKNELYSIIKLIVTSDIPYIIITKHGFKYVPIIFVKNICKNTSKIFSSKKVKIHHNYKLSTKSKKILNDAEEYYNSHIQNLPNIEPVTQQYKNLMHLTGGNQELFLNKNKCYIGYKQGYVFNNTYSIASTYTDWSIISYEPFNLFRDFDILSLLNSNYNDITKLQQYPQLLELYNLCYYSTNFLKSDTIQLYNLLNDILKKDNNIFNTHYTKNIIMNPGYHPVEYSSWNLINIINAYNIITFFTLYNNTSFSSLFNKYYNNYKFHINENKTILNKHYINNLVYYTIKSEYSNNLLATQNNYGYIITSNILNNALAHGSLFIRKIKGKGGIDSCINLYTNDLMSQKDYAHNIDITTLYTRQIYTINDTINITIPKYNPYITYSYNKINHIFDIQKNNTAYNINMFKPFTNDNNTIQIKYMFENYIINNKINLISNILNITHTYFNIDAYTKITIHPYDNNNKLIFNNKTDMYSHYDNYNNIKINNYLFNIDNVIKKYIQNHILIPLNVLKIPIPIFKMYFKNNKKIQLFVDKYDEPEFKKNLLQPIVNINCVILKKYTMTFKNYFIHITNNNKPESLGYVVFDIIYGLHLLNNKLNIIHNDLHHDNILLNNEKCLMYYLINNNIYSRTASYSIGIFDFGLSKMPNHEHKNFNIDYTSRYIFNINYGTMIDIFMLLATWCRYMHSCKYYSSMEPCFDQYYFIDLIDIEKIFNGSYDDKSKAVYYELTQILKIIFKSIPSEIKKVVNITIQNLKKNGIKNIDWPRFCKDTKSSCELPITKIFDGTQLLNELIKYKNIQLVQE